MVNDDRGRTPPLHDLDARLKSAREKASVSIDKSRSNPALPPSLVGIAMRAGVELVAGVAVGAGVGYGLDQWLGTSPWLLILSFILGAAAGMLNVYRSVAGLGMALGYQKGEEEKRPINGNLGK